MKRLDEREPYPPARWCPACRRLHNGGVVPRVCQCGAATEPVPEWMKPKERTWRKGKPDA